MYVLQEAKSAADSNSKVHCGVEFSVSADDVEDSVGLLTMGVVIMICSTDLLFRLRLSLRNSNKLNQIDSKEFSSLID